jgi:tRNA-specific 2-thiouridylase
MNFEFSTSRNYLESIGILIDESTYAQNQTKKVIVGMSGGVDSAVSLLLLKLQGYQVSGIFMKNWEEVDADGVCSAEVDYADVVKVCESLDVPYYALNFAAEYKEKVFQNFLDEYLKGDTPNPDIMCNREIKFKVFFEKAMLMGADYLATGHYAQIDYTEGVFKLKRAVDTTKDQTYFLYTIKSEILAKVLFPIGNLPKKTVRKIAADFNLANATKKDSTGICFIGERDFKTFLSQYIKGVKGNFVDLNGKVLGPHDGTCFYTIGQRKGLGIGGPGEPWFVAKKNLDLNQVVLVQGEEHPALYSQGLFASELSFVNGLDALEFPMRITAKIRYRATDYPCLVNMVDGKLEVVFDEPQRAITKSQSVVFYNGSTCLGGGIIDSVFPSLYDLHRDQDSFLLNPLIRNPDNHQSLPF